MLRFHATESACTLGVNAAASCELGRLAFAAVSSTIPTKLCPKATKEFIRNSADMYEL